MRDYGTSNRNPPTSTVLSFKDQELHTWMTDGSRISEEPLQFLDHLLATPCVVSSSSTFICCILVHSVKKICLKKKKSVNIFYKKKINFVLKKKCFSHSNSGLFLSLFVVKKKLFPRIIFRF